MSADDDNAPTAIVPSRPGSLEERWDTLARRLGDPLARLFVVNATSQDEENVIRSSDVLLSYRFAKKKPSEPPPPPSAPFIFNINVGAAPAPRTIDVTPAAPLLPDPTT